MRIRLIGPGDAGAYRTLCGKLDGETVFRLYEAGERTEDIADYSGEIERFLQNTKNAMFVVETEDTGTLVGYLQAIGRTPRRICHVVSVNIGILQEYTGKGLGKRLFAALEEWAREKGIRRIDLTVMENNVPAQKLYERLGFEREGVKKQSMCVAGAFVDEFYMSKWLG